MKLSGAEAHHKVAAVSERPPSPRTILVPDLHPHPNAASRRAVKSMEGFAESWRARKSVSEVASRGQGLLKSGQGALFLNPLSCSNPSNQKTLIFDLVLEALLLTSKQALKPFLDPVGLVQPLVHGVNDPNTWIAAYKLPLWRRSTQASRSTSNLNLEQCARICCLKGFLLPVSNWEACNIGAEWSPTPKFRAEDRPVLIAKK